MVNIKTRNISDSKARNSFEFFGMEILIFNGIENRNT